MIGILTYPLGCDYHSSNGGVDEKTVAPQRKNSNCQCAPAGVNLADLSEAVTYEGSSAHRLPHNDPVPPPDDYNATYCPWELTHTPEGRERVIMWLRDAICRGNASWIDRNEDPCPRYAYHREGDTMYAAPPYQQGTGNLQRIPAYA